jgi:hypothetical protein
MMVSLCRFCKPARMYLKKTLRRYFMTSMLEVSSKGAFMLHSSPSFQRFQGFLIPNTFAQSTLRVAFTKL